MAFEEEVAARKNFWRRLKQKTNDLIAKQVQAKIQAAENEHAPPTVSFFVFVSSCFCFVLFFLFFVCLVYVYCYFLSIFIL